MNEKKAPKPKYPSKGGGYVRNADGTLTQVEETTAPHPGKTAKRREAEAKALSTAGKRTRVAADTATTSENSNGKS